MMKRTHMLMAHCVALLIAGFLPAAMLAQSADFEELTMTSNLVPGEVKVGVLLPPGYRERKEPPALLLFLHGGGGDSSQLKERYRASFDAAWKEGALPPLVVATPSARRSFYMDYKDGSQKWETFLLTELLPRLRARYGLRTDAAGTFVAGLSMGGMGSLRLAFKHPDLFAAVASLEPAIEPAFAFDDIRPEDRAYRNGGVYEEIYGDPVDRVYWRANHPPFIARENLPLLIKSGMQIYIEVGDEDRLGLYRGAEVLHRLLFDAGVKHEYRLVRGGDHVGDSIPSRVADAVRFIGRVLRGGF